MLAWHRLLLIPGRGAWRDFVVDECAQSGQIIGKGRRVRFAHGFLIHSYRDASSRMIDCCRNLGVPKPVRGDEECSMSPETMEILALWKERPSFFSNGLMQWVAEVN